MPAAGEFVSIGAAIGVVLLLLTLGLEFSVVEFSSSLRGHVPSAVVDLVLNATPGAVAGWLLGMDLVGIVALAGATYISSSGIIARLLGDLRRLGNRETPAVLSVLVLEDFAMAAYLPLLAVLAGRAAPVASARGMAWRAGRWWLRSSRPSAGAATWRGCSHHDSARELLLRVLAMTLIVAALAEYVRVSAAVGAFLVGLALTGETADARAGCWPRCADLFAAVFFLSFGTTVDPADLPRCCPPPWCWPW